MNILVVNGYVRQNKGDGALLSVLCHELQASFPEAHIKISSQEDPQHDPRFEGWQNVGSLNRYCFDPTTGKLSHLVRLLLSAFVITTLPYVPRRLRLTAIGILPPTLRRQLSPLIQADLVVSMGGGYLNGNASLMANACVYLMLVPMELASRFGACVVCAPQSMGPFATVFQRTIVTRTLEKINLLLTREEKTIKILSALSPHFPIVPSVDCGFLFTSDTSIDLRRQLGLKRELLVGITVRHWLDPTRQRAYEHAIATTVDYLTSTYHASVVFIPQVTSALGGDDDRITARKVYAQIKHKSHVHVLQEEYTHQQIKSLYSSLDMIIGTRFHSVIFALTSHVPALAIEYEHKTSGIMHDLRLDRWVVKIEDAAADVLILKIDQLIVATRQYRRHLTRVLPAYVTKAQDAITHIEQAYRDSQPDPSTR